MHLQSVLCELTATGSYTGLVTVGPTKVATKSFLITKRSLCCKMKVHWVDEVDTLIRTRTIFYKLVKHTKNGLNKNLLTPRIFKLFGRTRLIEAQFQIGVSDLIHLTNGGQTQARQWSCPCISYIAYVCANLDIFANLDMSIHGIRVTLM